MGTTVDILMTTYETDIQYLKKQIESILNQTYSDFKLLISDDCSKGVELRRILESYQEKDSRIIIFFQERNIGYIKNFEFLLSKSTSDYICFCDHDDIWYPQKVEKSLKKLKDEKLDLVYVNANQIDGKDNILYESYFNYKSIPLVRRNDSLAASRCIGIGCSQIFTKEVKNRMLPYKEHVMAQDWLAAFVASEGRGMGYLEEPLFGYRLHGTNVFGGRSLSQNLDRWKKLHGKSYQSFLKYRNENVIKKAYLDGAIMCKEYSQNQENVLFLKRIIGYYRNVLKSKYVNVHWISYVKFLGSKDIPKKMLKEFVIFHLPIVGYIQFRIG